MRYDGIRDHIKKEHPDVDIPKGFTRKINERYFNTQTGESCLCKDCNFVSFSINNEKIYRQSKREYKFIKEYT